MDTTAAGEENLETIVVLHQQIREVFSDAGMAKPQAALYSMTEKSRFFLFTAYGL